MWLCCIGNLLPAASPRELDVLAFTLLSRDLPLACSDSVVGAKIYSLTDIFSDPRIQRSKRGNNSARSSEQQDMQALG